MRFFFSVFLFLLMQCLIFPCADAADAAAENSEIAAPQNTAGTKVAARPLETMTAQHLVDIIQENRGKIVLVNFFASWCPPCRAEIPDLKAIREEYPAEKVLMIGISLDQDMSQIKKFLDKTNFNYPVYLSDFKLPRMYTISSIPHNVIYLPEGKLFCNQPGVLPKQELNRLFDNVLQEAK